MQSIQHTFEKTNQGHQTWCNQPKGALQLLYECRIIGPSIPNPEKYYTIKGRKKRDGSIDLSTSLIYLLNLLPDFQDEETDGLWPNKWVLLLTEHPSVEWLEKALSTHGLVVNRHLG